MVMMGVKDLFKSGLASLQEATLERELGVGKKERVEIET
jgi:hypothetical protein